MSCTRDPVLFRCQCPGQIHSPEQGPAKWRKHPRQFDVASLRAFARSTRYAANQIRDPKRRKEARKRGARITRAAILRMRGLLLKEISSHLCISEIQIRLDLQKLERFARYRAALH